MTTMFSEYCENSEMHDLIIKIGHDNEFFAHKLILAMNSPFFKAQLYSEHWTLEKSYCSPKILKKKSLIKNDGE